jgi:prolyl-tRNA synthetase
MSAAGIEVLLDDREISPGAKFADAELLGCPVRLTIGKRSIAEGTVEVQVRRGREEMKFPRDKVIEEVAALLETL